MQAYNFRNRLQLYQSTGWILGPSATEAVLEARLVLGLPEAGPDLGATDCTPPPGLHMLVYNFRRPWLYQRSEDQREDRNQERRHPSNKD